MRSVGKPPRRSALRAVPKNGSREVHPRYTAGWSRKRCSCSGKGIEERNPGSVNRLISTPAGRLRDLTSLLQVLWTAAEPKKFGITEAPSSASTIYAVNEGPDCSGPSHERLRQSFLNTLFTASLMPPTAFLKSFLWAKSPLPSALGLASPVGFAETFLHFAAHVLGRTFYAITIRKVVIVGKLQPAIRCLKVQTLPPVPRQSGVARVLPSKCEGEFIGSPSAERKAPSLVPDHSDPDRGHPNPARLSYEIFWKQERCC